MRKRFLFDADDTLFLNQRDYDRAKIEFAEFMFETLQQRSPDLQSIINIQTNVDAKLVEDMGFSTERFPTSFRNTYALICEQLQERPNNKHSQQAYDIGMSVFDGSRWGPDKLLDGVARTLEFLKQQGDELYLVTKGDEEVQQRKVEKFALDRFFNKEHIYIFERKTPELLRELANGNKKTYKVGNSIRSDIIPALEAGIKAIYIPCETWQWEREHQGVPEHEKLIQIPCIEMITQTYDTL